MNINADYSPSQARTYETNSRETETKVQEARVRETRDRQDKEIENKAVLDEEKAAATVKEEREVQTYQASGTLAAQSPKEPASTMTFYA